MSVYIYSIVWLSILYSTVHALIYLPSLPLLERTENRMFDPIYVLLLLVLFQVGSADTNDQAGAPIDYGSFKYPSARVRARFRYWLPDSSVDTVTVQEDIKAAASVGAGGVEFVPFFNYGGALGGQPEGADWSTYGFGTPAFQKIFRAALEAHNDAGLVMDFALGPNQGQGVPAEPDDEGLQWDLVRILF